MFKGEPWAFHPIAFPFATGNTGYHIGSYSFVFRISPQEWIRLAAEYSDR